MRSSSPNCLHACLCGCLDGNEKPRRSLEFGRYQLLNRQTAPPDRFINRTWSISVRAAPRLLWIEEHPAQSCGTDAMLMTQTACSTITIETPAGIGDSGFVIKANRPQRTATATNGHPGGGGTQATHASMRVAQAHEYGIVRTKTDSDKLAIVTRVWR